VRRRLLPALLVAVFVLSAITPASAARAKLEPVAEGLAFPANFALSPDGRIFYVEKDTGNVRILENGELLPEPFFHLDVVAGGETGLLGIALHPEFPDKPWVYLYYSDATDGRNRLIRVLADGDRAGDVQQMIDGLTTENGYHNGGDIAFGLDGSLFLSLGEAHDAERAQDANDIGGKVLRIAADGNLLADNPFGPDNPVYSIGHRNSFGLCVDPSTGDLWETENGPTGDDEINRIVAGGNYGWPEQLGPGGAPTYVDPVVDYHDTIVPTGCAIWNGDLYVGSYGTGLLHRISLPATPGHAQDDVVANLRAPVTDVEAGPDGHLYVATTDAIYRIRGDAEAMSPIPVPSPVPPPPGGDGGAVTRLLAIAAAIALGLGLAMRFAAGHRLRRDLAAADVTDPGGGEEGPTDGDGGGAA
jgi:quinoprotein glucose dehydrogenase